MSLCPTVQPWPDMMVNGRISDRSVKTYHYLFGILADMMGSVTRFCMSVKDALFVITDKGLGAVSVVDDKKHLVGLLTDGDIRRGLSRGFAFLDRPVVEIMTKTPKTIAAHKLAAEALHLMESNKPRPITVLPVIDENRCVVGLLHMIPNLKAKAILF